MLHFNHSSEIKKSVSNVFIMRLKCVTWKSLSAFTNPPTSFLREKMIVARAFSDAFFSPFSSIFLKVDLFNCKHKSQIFIVCFGKSEQFHRGSKIFMGF